MDEQAIQPPITTVPSENPIEPPDAPWVKPFLIFLILAVLAVIGFAGYVFIARRASTQITVTPAPVRAAASIAGVVYFQGYAPQGAYIAIAEKSESEKDFKDVVSGLLPDKDGTTEWEWKDATAGHNYDMKATLKVQGKVVQESVVQRVSAPATQISLPLVSSLKPPAPTVATISGQINLDGYAPSGSTLQVVAKPVTSAPFSTVVRAISPTDNANWSWNNALEGTTYEVKAQLVSGNGAVISTGDTQTVTAPSGGELLNVYSTAKPPAPVVSGISGTITINGAIPSGAYITLATRPTGTATFNQVASNIAATNGVGFSWPQAAAGQSYDIQAYLWVNNKPYSQSNVMTVTAPSTFDVLTINAQQPTQAPQAGTLTVACGPTQGGLVQATFNFNTQGNLPNAASYTILVTSATQNQQLINTVVNPSNPTTPQSITSTFIFQPGATYYAQYAYATSVGGQMSALSTSTQFACQ